MARLCASCRLSGACLVVPDIKSYRPAHTTCVSCQQMAAWLEVVMDECVRWGNRSPAVFPARLATDHQWNGVNHAQDCWPRYLSSENRCLRT